MKDLRIEVSTQLSDRINARRSFYGSKSHIVRCALELYLTLAEGGVFNGTERVEDIAEVGRALCRKRNEARAAGTDGGE